MRIHVRIVLVTEEFLSLLSVTDYLNSQHQDCYVIVGGDFNVDFVHTSYHTRLLGEFCEQHNLHPVVLSLIHI